MWKYGLKRPQYVKLSPSPQLLSSQLLSSSPSSLLKRFTVKTKTHLLFTTTTQTRNFNSERIFDVQRKLENGDVTATDLALVHLERAKEVNKKCNIFTAITQEEALRAAKESDQRRKNKQTLGMLDGIPFSIKDNFCTMGIRTTAGSKMLHNFTPSYNATVFEKLSHEAGAVLIGKTNMDEFGMGSATTFSSFGPSINPLGEIQDEKEGLICGGSSGGSAASVASGACLFSIGSDTGGSVRQPAAYCGVVGMKPSYGVCSRFGLIAFASSLDTVGCFARSPREAGIVMQSMRSVDPKDSSSRSIESHVLTDDYSCDFSKVRIAIPVEYCIEELSEEISLKWGKAIDALKSMGAKVDYISLPHTQYSLLAYYIIAPAEASSNLSRYDGIRYGYREEITQKEGEPSLSMKELYATNRSTGFGDEVKRRIISGTLALSVDHYETYFKKAQQLRHLIWQDFQDAFHEKHYDFILTPTTPNATPISLDQHGKLSPVEVYANDIFTVPSSLGGFPALSLPLRSSVESTQFPVSLQVIAPQLQDDNLVQFCDSFGKLMEQVD